MGNGQRVKIKKLDKDAKLPLKATQGSAFWDIFSLDTRYLGPGEIYDFRTGLTFEVPSGYEIEVRPRSGLAKRGVTIINSPGTLDSDYRGELIILLVNLSGSWKLIEKGDRIAQIGVKPAPQVEFIEVDELSETERGKGGFGSTGR